MILKVLGGNDYIHAHEWFGFGVYLAYTWTASAVLGRLFGRLERVDISSLAKLDI